MEKEFSFLQKSVTKQTEEETLLILTYGLGKVIQCHHYAKRYGENGYKENIKVELGDVISMIRLFCEQKDWNFEEVKRLGEEHYIERMEDLNKYAKKEQLK